MLCRLDCKQARSNLPIKALVVIDAVSVRQHSCDRSSGTFTEQVPKRPMSTDVGYRM